VEKFYAIKLHIQGISVSAMHRGTLREIGGFTFG